MQMKPSNSEYGYTAKELASIFGVRLRHVKKAIDLEMHHSTVAIDPDTGERLIMPQDVRRIERMLRQMGKL